jgi:hypothetical protein
MVTDLVQVVDPSSPLDFHRSTPKLQADAKSGR